MPTEQAPRTSGLVLRRSRLAHAPELARIIAAVHAAGRGFVLRGRWGLPADADAAARVTVAGVAPSRILPPGADPFAALDAVAPLAVDPAHRAPDGAIGGGWVGWLGFDLAHRIEPTVGPQPPRPTAFPAAELAWYDDVLRGDEHGDWWIESLAAPERADAAHRAACDRWAARLDAAAAAPPAGRLGPAHLHRGAAAHRSAVREAIERIYAGELFQANICLRLDAALDGSAAGLVAGVLEQTDPWYGGWITDGAGHALVSASPELFLRRRGRQVTTAPIKGTRPRVAGEGTADAPAVRELMQSEKDRAEHVMIVDLMRNDLGRVCDYGSIVPEPEPSPQPHAGVWHLVSEVHGRLHDGFADGRLVRATFPPGSVTGAPKVQALRVIAAVEGTGREAYTGAHGLLSPVCGLDLAVTIRTLEVSGARAWLGVGGGIVADSDPQAELDEALSKAAALLAAAGSTIGETSETSDGGDVRGLLWQPSAGSRPDPARGLLETVAVRDRRAIRLEAHLERLASSAQALGVGIDAGLRASIDRTLEASPHADGRLRIELEPGQPARLEVVPFSPIDATGVLLAPFVLPGGLGPHKWRDRRLVDEAARRLQASPLLLDADGTALEAGWANLWWELDDGRLATPLADGRILPGITRQALLSASEGRCLELAAPALTELATRPLLLSSARGLTAARLAGSPPAAVARAIACADAYGALLS